MKKCQCDKGQGDDTSDNNGEAVAVVDTADACSKRGDMSSSLF